MTSKEIEELRNKLLFISNSEFPLIDFFNDIAMNTNEKFNKDRAYEDLKKIADLFIYYHNKTIKLEKVVEILKTKNISISDIKTSKNVTDYNSRIILNYSKNKLTREEWNLLKEVFNDRV